MLTILKMVTGRNGANTLSAVERVKADLRPGIWLFAPIQLIQIISNAVVAKLYLDNMYFLKKNIFKINCFFL
jgi:hypothetical protein